MAANDIEAASPVVRVPSRQLQRHVELGLVAASAGRCEFRGCRTFLYSHPLTGDPGNFGENAHIVAFREAGPRGQEGERPKDINGIENLMLLCQPCHHLVDRNPEKFPRAALEAHKREHEARIKRVTDLGPEMQTTVLKLKARIGTNVVEVGRAEVAQALMPRYPGDSEAILDLTALGDETAGAFYDLAATRIRQEAARLYAPEGELTRTKHLSVFGLAPIPLLVVLGNALSNKIATDFFQCHRDRSDRWTWHESGAEAGYVLEPLRKGTETDKVALLLSLSGAVDVGALPQSIDGSYSIYEIRLTSATPNPGFLRQRVDLDRFRQAYRAFLAMLRASHPKAEALHLFPAVPAPVAIACGFDLLPKIDPPIVVYDNVRGNGGFVQRLKVNDHDRQ